TPAGTWNGLRRRLPGDVPRSRPFRGSPIFLNGPQESVGHRRIFAASCGNVPPTDSGTCRNGTVGDMNSDFSEQRIKMVDGQIRTTDVTSAPLLDAMLTVPRENFIGDANPALAYID